MIIHNHEQGTPEWFKAREGKMTASEATAIGNCGAGLKTYITKMMSELYSSAEPVQFGNKDTHRGNELEAQARGIYSLKTGNPVQKVGFIEYNEYVGASPDGLVGEDGGTEIKCLEDKWHFNHILYGENEVDSGHVWQVQMNLLVTGRKWWDLIYYNPNYEKSICIYRIYPDAEKFEKLNKGFEMGIELIKEIKSKIE